MKKTLWLLVFLFSFATQINGLTPEASNDINKDFSELIANNMASAWLRMQHLAAQIYKEIDYQPYNDSYKLAVRELMYITQYLHNFQLDLIISILKKVTSKNLHNKINQLQSFIHLYDFDNNNGRNLIPMQTAVEPITLKDQQDKDKFISEIDDKDWQSLGKFYVFIARLKFAAALIIYYEKEQIVNCLKNSPELLRLQKNKSKNAKIKKSLAESLDNYIKLKKKLHLEGLFKLINNIDNNTFGTHYFDTLSYTNGDIHYIIHRRDAKSKLRKIKDSFYDNILNTSSDQRKILLEHYLSNNNNINYVNNLCVLALYFKVKCLIKTLSGTIILGLEDFIKTKQKKELSIDEMAKQIEGSDKKRSPKKCAPRSRAKESLLSKNKDRHTEQKPKPIAKKEEETEEKKPQPKNKAKRKKGRSRPTALGKTTAELLAKSNNLQLNNDTDAEKEAVITVTEPPLQAIMPTAAETTQNDIQGIAETQTEGLSQETWQEIQQSQIETLRSLLRNEKEKNKELETKIKSISGKSVDTSHEIFEISELMRNNSYLVNVLQSEELINQVNQQKIAQLILALENEKASNEYLAARLEEIKESYNNVTQEKAIKRAINKN